VKVYAPPSHARPKLKWHQQQCYRGEDDVRIKGKGPKLRMIEKIRHRLGNAAEQESERRKGNKRAENPH
jgi:hypothetical protein